jgi:hypothetical protein
MNVSILFAYMEIAERTGIEPTWTGLKRFHDVVVKDFMLHCESVGKLPSIDFLISDCVRLYSLGYAVI